MADNSLARDYVEGMWLMLQQSEPEDFVLATGETHPVREFVEKAFAELGTTITYVRNSPSPRNVLILMKTLVGEEAAWKKKALMQNRERLLSKSTAGISGLQRLSE